MKLNLKKFIIRVVIIGACLAVVGGLTLLGINIHVRNLVSERILTVEEAEDLGADCILVLGSGVKADGTPGNVLTDRLEKSLTLFENGAGKKLLMSGDHGRTNYDEVNVMKNYAMERGVSSEDVFMDHAGFSTYESMYRAAAIFQVEKAVIVTQKFHVYRSLYNALSMGIDAYAVASDLESYDESISRELREVLAIAKDFIYCIFKPEPTYLGEIIPVSGNGDLTNG
ncbi:MAG: YdcF family protein [Clostridia bacterium]|nr:YdcF family protein [Clostridia bacterium]